MRRWFLIVGVVFVIVAVVLHVHSVRERAAQEKRDLAYQAALRGYSSVLEPGMSRQKVEDYFRANSVAFRQMCCIDTNHFRKNVYDDLVKVGEEDPSFACDHKNVYVGFEFADGTPHDSGPSALPTDRLTQVTTYTWLEGCM